MENLTTKFKIDLLKFLQDCPYAYEEGTHNKDYVHIKFIMYSEQEHKNVERDIEQIQEQYKEENKKGE